MRSVISSRRSLDMQPPWHPKPQFRLEALPQVRLCKVPRRSRTTLLLLHHWSKLISFRRKLPKWASEGEVRAVMVYFLVLMPQRGHMPPWRSDFNEVRMGLRTKIRQFHIKDIYAVSDLSVSCPYPAHRFETLPQAATPSVERSKCPFPAWAACSFDVPDCMTGFIYLKPRAQKEMESTYNIMQVCVGPSGSHATK